MHSQYWQMKNKNVWWRCILNILVQFCYRARISWERLLNSTVRLKWSMRSSCEFDPLLLVSEFTGSDVTFWILLCRREKGYRGQFQRLQEQNKFHHLSVCRIIRICLCIHTYVCVHLSDDKKERILSSIAQAAGRFFPHERGCRFESLTSKYVSWLIIKKREFCQLKIAQATSHFLLRWDVVGSNLCTSKNMIN